jgi:Holliday junction resolvase-like predicted endonuclease
MKSSSLYQIRSSIFLDWCLPESTELSISRDVVGGISDYRITGTVGTSRVKQSLWKEDWPPHKRLANLPNVPFSDFGGPLVDPSAMMRFIEQFGPLRAKAVNRRFQEAFRHSVNIAEALTAIADAKSGAADTAESIAEVFSLADPQALLRYAWETANNEALKEIQRQAANLLEIRVSVETGGIDVIAHNVWGVVCVLFLRDQAAGRTGKCANPECSVPYFVKIRKTQKICQLDECAAWAQRRFAIDWWNKKGKKRRTQQQKHKRN